MSLPPSSAPTATGWSDSCRAGFAPAEEWRLVTAHRKYALRVVKQRLHQASFREAVIMAYNGRCALSGLPEPLLLDAAHIVTDANDRLGQPVVPNGLPLSKIHHAAFDAHLIGIDPDYGLHVSERLLGQQDGPMLKALTRLNGGTIHLEILSKVVDGVSSGGFLSDAIDEGHAIDDLDDQLSPVQCSPLFLRGQRQLEDHR